MNLTVKVIVGMVLGIVVGLGINLRGFERRRVIHQHVCC